MKKQYSLNLPKGFLEPESALKGWLEVCVIVGSKSYDLSFYDQTRLMQSIDSELTAEQPFFVDKNIVVIPEVNLKNMHNAIEGMLRKKTFTILLSEVFRE